MVKSMNMKLFTKLRRNVRACFFVVFVCLSHVLITGCSACSCNPLPTPEVLQETSGKLLVGHTYVTLQAKSSAVCAARCMRQRKCKSFNYQRSVVKCALNSASHVTAPESMAEITSGDVEYYVISQWDQTWLGSCRYHICPDDEICESVTGSSTITRMCSASYSADLPASPIDLLSLGVCAPSEGCAGCIHPAAYLGRVYRAHGCYSNHVLPHAITNMRGGLDWSAATTFINIVETCAGLSTGYELFGIEFYGECYAGNLSEATFTTAVPAASCDTHCLYLGVGVGSANVMFVYKWD